MYPEPGKRRKRLVIIAVGIVLALLIIIGLAARSAHKTSSANNPQKISDNFVNEVVQGQADASYQLYSDAAKASISKYSWQATVTRIKDNYKGQPASIGSTPEVKTGSIAVRQFKYRIGAKDTGNYLLTVFLTNNGNQWQVIQFNSSKEGTGN